MIFDYDASYAPPAPTLELAFSSPDTDRSTSPLRAFVDSGADAPPSRPNLCSKRFKQPLSMMPICVHNGANGAEFACISLMSELANGLSQASQWLETNVHRS